MVESAVTDVVSPAVAAEYPDGLLGKAVLVGKYLVGELPCLAGALGAAFKMLDERLRRLLRRFSLLECGKVILAQLLCLVVDERCELFNFALYGVAPCAVSKVHAVAEFGVVFEQRVRPCGAAAFLVLGVGAGGGGAAVDGGAARSVGYYHVFAEQLGDHLDVRGLAAACARAGELEQRRAELAALYGLFLELGGIDIGQLHSELPVLVLALFKRFGKGNHLYRAAVLYGAYGRAHAAAHAVEGRNLHLVLISGQAYRLLHLHGGGLLCAVGNECRPQAGVGAYERAGAALYAFVLYYLGHHDGNAALFELGRAGGNVSVGIELRGLELVALQVEDGLDYLLIILVRMAFNHGRARGCVRPACGHVNLFKVVARGAVYGVVVHLHNGVALPAEGLLGHVLHVFDGLVVGHYLGIDAEERRLKYGVRPAAQPELARDVYGVYHVEVDVLFGDVLLYLCGQEFFQLFNGGGVGVDEECAALLDVARHVVAGDVRGVGALNEVGRVDEVFALYGLVAETEVGHGYAARLLGIVEEVSLRVLVGVVAYYLYGVLVGAHGAVGAEAVELAGCGTFGRGVELFREVERAVGHVLVDAYGEVVLGFVLFKILVDGEHHRRGELLGAEAVAAADCLYIAHALFEQRRAYVEV